MLDIRNMEDYYISLFDLETRKMSNRVSLKDVIYNQSDIEFVFSSDEIGEETLPYDDFLFYRQDYQVILEFDKREEQH